MISGTFDIPVTSNGWIRVDGCRLPFGPEGSHLSCIDVGAVGVTSPAAAVSPYFGVSYGIYRASFDRGAPLPWKGGVHFYGGAQVRLSDHLALDAGLGVHLLRDDGLDPGLVAPAEAAVRVKFSI